jgi:methionine-gamma-lyase
MMDRLRRIARAVSLGDAESRTMHPASLTRPPAQPAHGAAHHRGSATTSCGCSVGLEDVEDLIDDLRQALNGA